MVDLNRDSFSVAMAALGFGGPRLRMADQNRIGLL